MTQADRPRILIVEDEAVTSLRLARLIEEAGGEVVGPAGTVREALTLAEAVVLDGAVLDVNLEGVPVYSVADRLARQDVPFIFLTGYGAQAVPPAHAERRVIQKPFRGDDLARALQEEFCLPPSSRAV
jgi:CheY-like chemotaxis protein